MSVVSYTHLAIIHRFLLLQLIFFFCVSYSVKFWQNRTRIFIHFINNSDSATFATGDTIFSQLHRVRVHMYSIAYEIRKTC